MDFLEGSFCPRLINYRKTLEVVTNEVGERAALHWRMPRYTYTDLVYFFLLKNNFTYTRVVHHRSKIESKK